MTQPLCRCCGKKIPKHTKAIYFSSDANPPRTLSEAQRRTNHQIVKHQFWGKDEHRHVWVVYTWDGESYADKYFCTKTCAEKLGRMAAENGASTQAYQTALAKK